MAKAGRLESCAADPACDHHASVGQRHAHRPPRDLLRLLGLCLADVTSARRGIGAGDGNRTHVSSLGSYSSTIELHPHRAGILCRIPTGSKLLPAPVGKAAVRHRSRTLAPARCARPPGRAETTAPRRVAPRRGPASVPDAGPGRYSRDSTSRPADKVTRNAMLMINMIDPP